MDLVIGTDEAGYGPNIGPLVIGGTAWIVDDGTSDLFDVFAGVYSRVGEEIDGTIVAGDSKQLFQPGAGLKKLERAILPLVMKRIPMASDQNPLKWLQLLQALGDSRSPTLANQSPAAVELPWYDKFDPCLPIDLSDDDLANAVTASKFERSSQAFLQRVQMIEPARFNQDCELLGNKATLLSHATLKLVVSLIDDALESGLSIDRVFILCDKHGGRSSYAGMIQSFFEDCWVQVVQEERNLSVYSFCHDGRDYRFEFVAKGESHLPIAVASMMAKYCREISMQAFNHFWLNKDESLKETAGYPVDAKRFRKDIEAYLPALGLQETDWWRLR